MNLRKLMVLVNYMGHHNSMPLKDIADKVGKKHRYLSRELNLEDEGAKLGLETYCKMLEVTGDHESLEFIANELGYYLVKRQPDV